MFLVENKFIIQFKVLKKVKTYCNSASKITFLLIFGVIVFTTFNLKHWSSSHKKEKVIVSDIISYYSYLPATFIYHDIKFGFLDDSSISAEDKRLFWPKRFNADLQKDSTGEIRVIKMTMGMSFMYAPFFLCAHQYASMSRYKANGFSEPYAFFLVMSCLFYFFIGLAYLRKILLFSFSEWVASITLVTIVIGTNLFYYVIGIPAMSHAYSFALIVGLVYQSIKWINEGSLRRSIYIGLLGGLIVLIRPVNILIFLFPLLYGVYTKKLLKERFQFFLKNYTHLVAIGVLSFLVLLPQFLYWKYITGSWLFYSYVEEQFYFGNPHILEGLFSYRKGWLLYTPIMIFALIGMFLLKKHNKKYFLPITLFFLTNTYVMYSWWCWWYGGSFGSRPMVDSYGLMAIPLACFYSFVLKKNYVRQFVITITILLIGLNQFQIFQRRRTMIHWDSMTKKAYWNVFLGQKFSEKEKANYKNSLVSPDYSKAMKGEDEYDFTLF